jgi:hypothetical protein
MQWENGMLIEALGNFRLLKKCYNAKSKAT